MDWDHSTGDAENEVEVAMHLPTFWREVQDEQVLRDMADMNLVGGEFVGRTGLYETLRKYYDGEHKSELTSRAKQYLLQVEGVDYAENICDLIVDAMADRLTVKGWAKDTDGKNPELHKSTEDIWLHSNMAETHRTAISRTLELGDGFLVVDYDADAKMPTIHFNHPKMMKVEYEPSNPQKKRYAVKVWKDDAVGPMNPRGEAMLRMNVYFDGWIERYCSIESEGTNWIAWWDEDEEFWPIPWTNTNEPSDNPDEYRGIPVFHLKNKARGNNYGVSEIKKAIPLQNSLNKLWLDLFEVADQQGFQQRWGAGVAKAEANAIIAGAGTFWTSSNPEAKFGQFNAADLNQLVNIIDTRYRTIAGTTSTPIHMLVLAKGILSGEALKKSEAGLVAKVKDRQPVFGHEFSCAMSMCLEILVDNGTAITGFKPGETRLVPIWVEAENIDEEERMATAEAKRRVGVPLRKVFEELGYENVDQLMEWVKDELEQAQATRAAGEGQAAGGTASNDAQKNADGNKTPKMQKQQMKSTGRSVDQ